MILIFKALQISSLLLLNFLFFILQDQPTKDYDAIVFDVLKVNPEEIAVCQQAC